ncbi:hypothetical protein Q3G72_029808 [Acer saccharum]|nr:hypothetical protein Q3G72_029808 [Acer saccharum]
MKRGGCHHHLNHQYHAELVRKIQQQPPCLVSLHLFKLKLCIIKTVKDSFLLLLHKKEKKKEQPLFKNQILSLAEREFG